MDATLIRADVSLGSLVAQHLDAVDLANLDEDDRLSRTTGKFKKLCVTDPDATMATSSAGPQLLPAYKQHTSDDDRAGVIVDIEVVTGQEADFAHMFERLDALEVTLGRRPGTVTADRAYGIGRVYAALSERNISAVFPPRPSTRQAKAKGFPIERFRYDARHDVVRCPRKKVMTPRSTTKSGHWFRASADACRTGALRERCIPDGGATRRVHITGTYVDVLRARRKRLAWGCTRNPTLHPPSLAGRRRTRTGQNPAWHGQSRQTRPQKHENPGPTHRHSHQPQAAGEGDPACSAPRLPISPK